MAVSLTQIAHGSAGWDQVANGNFDKLNQDTGWVNLTLIGATKGMYGDSVPQARRINGVVKLMGGITATEDIPSGTLLATFPDSFLPIDGTTIVSIVRGEAKVAIPMSVTQKGIEISDMLSKDDGIDLNGLIYLGKEMK